MNNIYTKIKRLASISLLAVIVLSYSSCEKDTIELTPPDRITDKDAYSTAERCALSITGVYAQAQSGRYPGNLATRGYPFGAASIIQSDMRGEDMLNVAAFFQQTYETLYTTASPNNQAMWENSLTAIASVNLGIDGVRIAGESGIITPRQAEIYEGECRFLRALIYHNLLIHFARPYAEAGNNKYGIPYIDYPLYSTADFEKATNHGRNTVQDCYVKILEDLNYAESKLTDANVGSISRAGQAAAIALKVRVNLHKADYVAVKTEAQKLVPAAAPFVSPIGTYKLTDDPYAPFAAYQSNTESIFSIENSSDRNATTNGSLNTMLTASASKGRALVAVSPIIYNNTYWLAPGKDKRRDMLANNFANNPAANPVYYTKKYSENAEMMATWAPIIRYAEVLLNYSEAIIRGGGSIAEALPYLNAVRDRSLVNPAADTYTAAYFTTTKDFVNALYAEKRIEFIGEGRRWEDIHRLLLDPEYSAKGIPAKISYTNVLARITSSYLVNQPVSVSDSIHLDKTKGPEGYIPYADRRSIWPIPESSTIINSLLYEQQNEGWK